MSPQWLDKYLTHGCSINVCWVSNVSTITTQLQHINHLRLIWQAFSLLSQLAILIIQSRNLKLFPVSYQGNHFPSGTPFTGNLKIRLKSKVSIISKVPTPTLQDANPSWLLIGNQNLLHPVQLLTENNSASRDKVVFTPTPPPPGGRIRRDSCWLPAMDTHTARVPTVSQ